MSSNYFRCNDPSKRCRNSASRKILKNSDDFSCPCGNPDCALYREEVNTLDGITNGKAKVVYLYCIIAALLLTGLGIFWAMQDPVNDALTGFRERLAILEGNVSTLEHKFNNTANNKTPIVIESIQSNINALEKETSDTIATKNLDRVKDIKKNILTQNDAIHQIKGKLQKLPTNELKNLESDSKKVLTDLNQLKNDKDSEIELLSPKYDNVENQFSEFNSELAATQKRAKKILDLTLARNKDKTEEVVAKELEKLLARLEASDKKLSHFLSSHIPQKEEVSIPLLPFSKKEANLVIVAVENTAKDLIIPLLKSWKNCNSFEDPSNKTDFYLINNQGEKFFIKIVSSNAGFKMLASGECDLFFADRTLTPEENSLFDEDFSENRSVAEIIALDALTFLVHPENNLSTYNPETYNNTKIITGDKSPILSEKLNQLGIPANDSASLSGEAAALSDKNIISASFYHTDGINFRAKRLGVQANKEALEFKPSPFTIGTEDYLYSFRIIAWTPKKAKNEALNFVKFTTSDRGQQIVSNQGFVDLRLKSNNQGENIPPEILAALGSALNSDSISSAIRLSTNFRFEVAKANLDLKAESDLERLPKYVFEKYPNHKVVILGFTDSDGSSDFNMKLSKERAESVAKELRRSKVDVRSSGLGPIFPLDTNKTVTGKAKNRRAEVWIVKP